MLLEYFRNDLWDDINSLDIEKRKRAKDEWTANAESYWEQYDRLMVTRLDEKPFHFLKDNRFHDCTVIECKVTQSKGSFPHSSSFVVVVEFEEEHWMIEYSKVTSLCIQLYEDTDGNGSGLKEWGYHEILPVNDSVLSHEILFASGATIKVAFLDQDISVKQR